MKRRYLMTPGPSPVPASVREALAREIIHHRTDEFRRIIEQVKHGLKYVFATNNPVILFSSSGTGAMEAAVVNFLSEGDKVIVVCGGKFGERWREICGEYRLKTVSVDIEWGMAPSPKEIKNLLDKNSDVKAVFTTLCETSTATVYDIEGIAKVVRESNAILVVDAISGLGQDCLLTDEWGVDVVVSGSQKGFMLPPGLSFISVSTKAKELMKEASLPCYYFDLKKALESYEKNDTPFTPPVSLIIGLEESLRIIREEGLENRWERFSRLAQATREAAESLGLKIFSHSPSSSVTAILSPEGIKSTDIVKIMRKEYGISIAAGQGKIKDKIFRIAHMGWINEQDMFMCFSVLEKVLKDLGYKFKLGISLERLEEVLYG